jgi:UDP-N-acetyl-2-amino-2-deoxyglucuronate dehydrogenase
MTAPTKYQFVVIGYGHIGKRHADMIRQNQAAELVAVVDTLPIEGIQEAYFSSLEALFASELRFDVAVIATPNYLHAPQAIMCLNHNKHVIVEKPFTLNASDAEAIISLAQQQAKQVFCVMQNRYSPPAKWLKSIIESGKLGSLYMVQINCFWNRGDGYYQQSDWRGQTQTDGGTLYTQFSHFIDMMYWLFGPISNVQSRFANFNHTDTIQFEDTGLIHFEFDQGGIGSFNYTTSVYQKNLESSITIVAENGTIKVGGQYMNEVLYCDVKSYEMPQIEASLPPNDYGHYKGSAANHQYIYQNVIEVLNGAAEIDATAEQGMKVVEIIENIYQTNPFLTKK